MADQSVLLKDLGYELQLLLGADEIVRFIEAHDTSVGVDADKFGNLVNYFKDSIYVHARNLLNALTNGYPTEIDVIPSTISSAVYGRVKDSLETYVTHLKKPATNVV
jgi:hypothetical protein